MSVTESPLANVAPDLAVREKLEGGRRLVMHTEYTAAGDQPTAITELSEGLDNGERDQVLLGATGTGKTFTMAKVIEATQRPAIILAPNKTLAAQLYGEFKSFFPENAANHNVLSIAQSKSGLVMIIDYKRGKGEKREQPQS